MNKSIITSLILLSCSLQAVESKMNVRHREAGGVGYNKGYSTVDYSFVTEGEGTQYRLDLRGHVFNDGRGAGNAGVGFRWPIHHEKNLIGTNFFYDFREVPHLFAHQIGTGVEWLTKRVDIRLNGYLPLGKKKSLESKSSFETFSGHTVYIKRKLKATLPCIEGEVGTPLPKPFYFAVGTYYLFKEHNHSIDVGNAWGGKVRAEVELGRYFMVGGAVTFDSIFKTRVQGIISLHIPLGPNPKNPPKFRNLRQIPIMRNEIIPIQDKRKSKEILTAGDDPVTFLFVDNSVFATGDGSFEKPFMSLKEAEAHSKPGDVIYVYPGSGTADHMDEGIVLKEDQVLASSGAPLQIGNVMIPPQTPGHMPVITNIHMDQPVVTNPGRSRLDDFFFLLPFQYLYDWYRGSSDITAPSKPSNFENQLVPSSLENSWIVPDAGPAPLPVDVGWVMVPHDLPSTGINQDS